MKISNFFKDEYQQAALYQSFRTIGSVCDGLKNGARKCVYTFDKYNTNSDIKVSQMMAKVSETTQWLHGEVSLGGAIIGLAQDFTGSNNINVLSPEGNFGSRFMPDPAAVRYIYTKKSDYFDKIFNPLDKPVLLPQEFEGDTIEYKHYIPVLPMLLVNGAEGIGNGFAQKILPRNPSVLKRELLKYIEDSNYKIKDIDPWFKGFTGSVERIEDSWLIKGVFERLSKTSIKITEVPVTYSLKQYLKVLETLIEKKVIRNYFDRSEDDSFSFTINVTRDFSENTDSWIMDQLKLSKRVSENFTAVSENNAILEFTNEKEILKYYIDLRLKFYKLRKAYMIADLKDQINFLNSKVLFIRSILNGDIIINNKAKKDIIEQIKLIPKIMMVDDSYDYLLKMPIYSLTKEKIDELTRLLESKKLQLKELKDITINEMWKNDLKNL